MRKILFYLFVLKKIILLVIYPLLKKDKAFFVFIKKNIENYLIFQPSKLRAKRIKRGLLKKITPQRFINEEGIKLYGWFIKPQNNMPVILHFHGQAESILSHQDVALYCLKQGLGLFMLSYRGHYKSSGRPSEQGLYNDAQATIFQLKKLGVDIDKIILWGHSLGTAVALETAKHNKVLGVILQSPIKEIQSAAIDVYDFYCKRLHLNFLNIFIKTLIQNINFIQKLNNIEKIKHLKCPILILHPQNDKITPFENAFKLASQNLNTKVYLSEKGSHWDSDWGFEKVFEFVNNLEYNELVNSQQ